MVAKTVAKMVAFLNATMYGIINVIIYARSLILKITALMAFFNV